MMRVLVITGDRSFAPGHPRFQLQAETLDRLEAVYWGRGAVVPKISRGTFDVVSVQDPFLRGLYAFFIARRMGARFNVQMHADLAQQPLWKRLIAGFVLRRADSIRVVSEKIKAQVLELNARAPVSIVPIFVDTEKFRAVVRTPQHPPVILWIGRFEDEKDPLLAIRVLKDVNKRVPARLIMLGSGSLERRLKHEAEGFPIEFPGWQSDVTPYLAKASVVLSTSREESWGASIIESLAAGVPVVAPDVGIAQDAGAIVVPREMLADAALRTLSNPILGALRVPLFSREEWKKAWRAAL